MATQKQKAAAKENIKQAQKSWQTMSHRERAMAQPQDEERAEVGAKGEGDYYRIEVRPKKEFTTFRYHDVGEEGKILRLAGKRTSGSWDDHAWLIHKDMARVENGELKAHDQEAQDILETYGPAVLIVGDRFKGRPRPNVPEKEKPTAVQRQAYMHNIRKAQKARRRWTYTG